MICQDVSTVREPSAGARGVGVDCRPRAATADQRHHPAHVPAAQGQLSSEQRDSVEQIARSIHSLGRMVADLMDASLLESDRLRVSWRGSISVSSCSDVVTDAFRRRRARTSTPPPTRLLRQRRRAASRAGDLQPAVQLGEYAPPETDVVVDLGLAAGQAHIRVTNFGEPIPADELPFIFNRFARTRAAGASGVTGLGLGLYIARGLVSAHHGRIWAESGATDGTTFHITLPLDGPPVPVEPPADRIRLPAQGGVTPCRCPLVASRAGLSAGAGAWRASGSPR